MYFLAILVAFLSVGFLSFFYTLYKKQNQLVDLYKSSWRYMPFASCDRNTTQDIQTLVEQRTEFFKDNLPLFLTDLLKQQINYKGFGWHVNNYQHALQMATFAWKSNPNDLEMIVMALFHDVFYYVAPDNHGEIAFSLFQPYFRQDVIRIMRYHDVLFESITNLKIPMSIVKMFEDENDSEWMRGLRLFRKWDAAANIVDCNTKPIEFFEPMIAKVLTWKKYIHHTHKL